MCETQLEWELMVILTEKHDFHRKTTQNSSNQQQFWFN